jgi:hypothetical protein
MEQTIENEEKQSLESERISYPESEDKLRPDQVPTRIDHTRSRLKASLFLKKSLPLKISCLNPLSICQES